MTHTEIASQCPSVPSHNPTCGMCGNYSLERGYCVPRANADLPCNYPAPSIKAASCPFYYQVTGF